MRIVVVGAGGFIGSALTSRLLDDGHDVVAIARTRKRGLDHPRLRRKRLDLKGLTAPADWEPLLPGADAVLYCAGALQDGALENPDLAHRTAPKALYAACEAAGVKRVIHFSAIGVDREQRSSFSETKIAGDDALTKRDLDWIILRPSIVVGRAAAGSGALLRQLAAMPVLLLPRSDQPLQIVQLDDVIETAAFFLKTDAPKKLALELAGPERLTLGDAVSEYREWLGWSAAPRATLPALIAALAFFAGDFAGNLGWRSAMRGNAAKELQRGAAGDPSEWMRVTGIRPKSLREALTQSPASEQDRWHASLSLLKPMMLLGLAAYWAATGGVSIGPGYSAGIGYTDDAGAGLLGGPTVVAGGIADMCVGFALLHRRTARPALLAGIGISLFYFAAGTALLPVLWLDPLGPMLKIWPIVACHLVMLAIVEKR